MRVVGGRWAGRDLLSPSGRVRPTAEAVREAAARMVAAELQGARTLDLFAGTGAVGIEFLSRGARSCDFVEHDPSALHALKANVAGLRLPEGRTRIFRKDAIPFVEELVARGGGGSTPAGTWRGRGGPAPQGDGFPYDLAYADPPWGSRKLDRVVEAWHARPFSRLLLVEHAADHPFPEPRGPEPRSLHPHGPEPPGGASVVTVRVQVGDAMLTLLRISGDGAPGPRAAAPAGGGTTP